MDRSKIIERGKKNNVKRIPDRRNKKNFARVLFYFSGLSFGAALVYVLFFSGFLALAEIKISGNEFIDSQEIRDEIERRISGRYLNLIEKNNFLLVSGRSVKKDLAGRFRLVENIEVRKKFPDSLEIKILERKPSLGVCSGGCYVLDENGTAYDDTDPESEEFKAYGVPTLSDQSGKSIGLGENIVSPEYMNYLAGMKKALGEDLGLDFGNKFSTPNLVSDDVRANVSQGWVIYFNVGIDLEKEVGMLKAVLNSQIAPDKRGELEYIDLRIENKIFYKFKQSENPEEIDSQDAPAQESQAEPEDKTDKKKKKK